MVAGAALAFTQLLLFAGRAQQFVNAVEEGQGPVGHGEHRLPHLLWMAFGAGVRRWWRQDGTLREPGHGRPVVGRVEEAVPRLRQAFPHLRSPVIPVVRDRAAVFPRRRDRSSDGDPHDQVAIKDERPQRLCLVVAVDARQRQAQHVRQPREDNGRLGAERRLQEAGQRREGGRGLVAEVDGGYVEGAEGEVDEGRGHPLRIDLGEVEHGHLSRLADHGQLGVERLKERRRCEGARKA